MDDGGVAFDAELIRRYDRRGPRYTSYPTAASFGPYSEAEYRKWAQLGNGDPVPRALSLYVHLPFCRTVCFYCACNRIVTANAKRLSAYLERLHREIALQGGLYDRDRVVEQLAWGGGTPNLLSLPQMETLMGWLRDAFSLRDDDRGDYSIELDPRQCEPRSLETLRRLGFNRVSFGLQDLDPAVQAAVNRVQPTEHVLGLLQAARAARFRSISVDLIYGLPRQTVAGFAETIETVVDASPDRLAVFNYAHLPSLFKAQRQIDESELPDPSQKLLMLWEAIERLTRAGYVYIGMDHFARPTDELARARRARTLTRNFQGYSARAGCELVGLGVSAISMNDDAYAQNARDIGTYSQRLDEGRLATSSGIVLDDDDRIRRDVIMELMCYGSLDTPAIERRWSLDFATYFGPERRALGPLIADGLVAWEGPVLRVQPRGRLLVRNVCMLFDRYLRDSAPPAPFSRAI